MKSERRPARRPSEDSAAAAKPPLQLFDAQNTAPRLQIAQEWDRRRAAERRLPPLADGRRDPLRPASQPGTPAERRSLHVEVGKRTAWLYGDGLKTEWRRGKKVIGLLDRAEIDRRQWDFTRHAWMVPVDRADDVITVAEWKQRRVVTVEAVDR